MGRLPNMPVEERELLDRVRAARKSDASQATVEARRLEREARELVRRAGKLRVLARSLNGGGR